MFKKWRNYLSLEDLVDFFKILIFVGTGLWWGGEPGGVSFEVAGFLEALDIDSGVFFFLAESWSVFLADSGVLLAESWVLLAALEGAGVQVFEVLPVDLAGVACLSRLPSSSSSSRLPSLQDRKWGEVSIAELNGNELIVLLLRLRTESMGSKPAQWNECKLTSSSLQVNMYALSSKPFAFKWTQESLKVITRLYRSPTQTTKGKSKFGHYKNSHIIYCNW